ncbi:zinc-binding dehydrogenase [Ruania zhangjianzhongii]|uniref:zinc-binding dehydrogenase n=1 Tax=Ruania zhangjianzhongii TaxID=2603206 RepID=UPI0011C75E4B|nr:zinc-binding dehydrogenase [Ruania zhangjianzhongii]
MTPRTTATTPTTEGSDLAQSGTAAIWSGTADRFAIEPVPLPELASGEVLVRTELATICGSDLHTINGDRDTPLPTVLGHEAIGHVLATGGGVLAADGRPVTAGDRITWTIGTSCGLCRRCRRGIGQKCEQVRKYGHEAMDEHWQFNGGFASLVHLIAGTGLVHLSEEVPAAVATPANCATATVTCAARRVDLASDDVVVVLGCGMLGLTAIAYAKDAGCETVIASDIDPERLKLASTVGASHTVAPDELAATTAAHGADVVIELSGNSHAVQSAFDLIGLGGRIALVGSVSPAPEISFEPSGYVRNLTTVVGSHNYRVDDLVEAVAFLERTPAQATLAGLVSVPYPLAEIETAVEAANSGAAPRVAVAPN